MTASGVIRSGDGGGAGAVSLSAPVDRAGYWSVGACGTAGEVRLASVAGAVVSAGSEISGGADAEVHGGVGGTDGWLTTV